MSTGGQSGDDYGQLEDAYGHHKSSSDANTKHLFSFCINLYLTGNFR